MGVLGALLEAVERQVVELHAQAAADAAVMRMALLAVEDACPGSGGCGQGGGRGRLGRACFPRTRKQQKGIES